MLGLYDWVSRSLRVWPAGVHWLRLRAEQVEVEEEEDTSATYEGLLFNVNHATNVLYLLGTVVTFCWLFVPLIGAWNDNSSVSEWLGKKTWVTPAAAAIARHSQSRLLPALDAVCLSGLESTLLLKVKREALSGLLKSSSLYLVLFLYSSCFSFTCQLLFCSVLCFHHHRVFPHSALPVMNTT